MFTIIRGGRYGRVGLHRRVQGRFSRGVAAGAVAPESRGTVEGPPAGDVLRSRISGVEHVGRIVARVLARILAGSGAVSW